MEGGVIHTTGGWPHRPVRARYRVDEFRRVLRDGNRPGGGLVQFWGAKMVSALDPATNQWSPWAPPDCVDPDGLHTVEINSVEKISDQRRRSS